MRLFIENMSGKTELPFENGKHRLCLYNNNILIELFENEETRVVYSNQEAFFQGEGQYRIPIVWGKNNSFTCSVRTKNSVAKYVLELENVKNFDDEDILNLFRFVDQMDANFMIGKDYPVVDLYEAIKEDRVSLIIEKTPFVGYDDQSLLNRISETVPMVMNICSHPKQSLRTEEAVLDVNLVKRINSRTMDHLASHSEHWKARTLNGLTPNRLRADIFEDEINIYENLFFRMAVDDILKYIHRQVISIEKTIQQNDNAIDWNAYGSTLFDYKRMRIFEQLLPDYDVNERKDTNISLENLLLQWRKLEKHFSTVEASQFYRSIDRKRHISRNIKPTNILKKDSRYNALYRLWCDIQRQVVLEQQNAREIVGTGEISLSDCYSMYVVVLLLYVFKLMECSVDETSAFTVQEDGGISVEASFRSENMSYHVTSMKNAFGTLEIHVKYMERLDFVFNIPDEIHVLLNEVYKVLPKTAEVDDHDNKLIFHADPSPDEKKALKNVFHLGNAAKKGMSKEEARRMDTADSVWRQLLEEYFSSGVIRKAHSEEITIIPQFVLIAPVENAVERYTKTDFDSVNGKTIFTLPIDISVYRGIVKSERLLNRMLNYGEKYSEEDADAWGDYKVGMLPIAQTEINSAQRLMKLISIHGSRLQIRWQTENAVCPICGSKDCFEESKDSWKCNNPECGVLFGITKHDKEKGGCGASYEWTRPYVSIKNSDIPNDDYLDLLLKKELIFDRLTITDFELNKQTDGTVKYIPICPKCGKRPKTM